MEHSKLPLDRRDFLGLAASAAVLGIGAAAPAGVAAAVESPATDFTRWLDSINGRQKALLDVREPNDGMAMAWAWVFLFTAPQAYGISESEVGVAMVFRHNAIPVVFADGMWSKYKLGDYFKITDPTTGKPAVRNPYYATMADPFLPDMALQKLIARGVRVVACDMAIFFYSGQIAKQQGLKHEDVMADWNANVLPGIAHAPSGVVACQGAASRGCTYVYAG